MKLYFKDNFFNSGKTEIFNEQQETLGEIDLRSSFGAGLDIYDANASLICSGKFPMLRKQNWVRHRSAANT